MPCQSVTRDSAAIHMCDVRQVPCQSVTRDSAAIHMCDVRQVPCQSVTGDSAAIHICVMSDKCHVNQLLVTVLLFTSV